MPTLAYRLVGERLAPVELSVGFGGEGFVLADGAYAVEACFLEEGIQVSHHREGFDPGHRTRGTTGPYEIACQTGATVRGMDHDAREHPQLLVQLLEGERTAPTGDAEVLVAKSQGTSGCREDADADGACAVPEEVDPFDEAERVAAIVPTGEVGPVSTGARPVLTVGKNEMRRLPGCFST